ncbi:hypothetical protein EV586_1026 [Tumebacillus sp. BK434]|uniref:hypothetical protein n=1 Tax=Tumebacillus sp. BK434 TaxID=2512169 RepID=UPI00104BB674|nr:hypothetical protein [Tumebacillus sp. BK434]TCP57565.1 hypothetical protein EV586_1026 [Tumebacillus sp. BK434]
MNKKNIRKLLQGNPKFNPFNDSFDFSELTRLLDSEDQESSIALSTPIFNMYYRDMYAKLGEFVKKYNKSNEYMFKCFLGAVNSDYLNLKKSIVELAPNEYNLQELSCMRISSPISHFGEMNILGSFETAVETFNIIVNYLRFFNNGDMSLNFQESEIRLDVSRTYAIANIYYNVKNAYDEALWEDGYVEIKENLLSIRYKDKQYPLKRQVGVFRQQQNIISYLVILEELLKGTGSISIRSRTTLLRDSFMAKKKPVALINTSVNTKGTISYRLSTSKSDLKINDYMKEGQSSIAAYYPHFKDIKLQKLNNLTISDLLVLLSLLVELVTGINELELDTKSLHLKQLAFKIRENDLIKFFTKTTFYSDKDIKAFLSLVGATGSSDSRINLWRTPLIKYRDIYYVCMPSIAAPNFLYLIDEWLEVGGYGIEARGILFERFVKNITRQHLNKRKIHFTIPSRDKFYNEIGKYEEIDMIISLEGLIIVCELKNIKYPMEPRDYHNSLKRLRAGADQATRKAKFIVENQKCFIDELGEIKNKEVFPIVITNFSIFSGITINNIPIIDLFLLESYIGSGEYKKIKVAISESQTTRTQVELIKYYENSAEFLSNITGFLRFPFPIQDALENVYVEDRVITLESASPQIFVEVADYKKANV